MNDRRQFGVLALAGAVVMAIGCWLPYNSQGGLDYEVFRRRADIAGSSTTPST
jgi:hypothetical protein